MKRLLWLIFIAVATTFFVRTFLFEGIYIASDSMLPTLQLNDHFFVDKITYHFRQPARGEIVVFKSPVFEEKDLVKRIIAIGNDTVSVKNKDIYVNGQKLEEPYKQHTSPDVVLKGDRIDELKVHDNWFFVLGDNRDESKDSRDWVNAETGEHIYFIHKLDIKGKIIRF